MDEESDLLGELDIDGHAAFLVDIDLGSLAHSVPNLQCTSSLCQFDKNTYLALYYGLPPPPSAAARERNK